MNKKDVTKKAISARVNRAAWDWLEMNGYNKNRIIDELLERFVLVLQRNTFAKDDFDKEEIETWQVLTRNI